MKFTADKCEVLNKDGELVVSGTEEAGLYRLNQPERAFLANGIQLWHRRMGNLNDSSLKQLKTVSDGVGFQGEKVGIAQFALKGTNHEDRFRQAYPEHW